VFWGLLDDIRYLYMKKSSPFDDRVKHVAQRKSQSQNTSAIIHGIPFIIIKD
jgi:hypothetical protein